MTMQAVSPSPPGIAWDDLRPDLLARFRIGMTGRPGVTGAADFSPLPTKALRDLLEPFGLTTAGTEGGVPTPACLLLFGTEDAISRHFPFLRTRLTHRDPDHRREHVIDLPGNIPDCLKALADFVARDVPDRHEAGDARGAGYHASLRDAAILPWLFEMAVSRDYSQVKVARFVRDRDYVFLEYPRHVARDDQPDHLSRPRYVPHDGLQRILACLFPNLAPTMQAGHEAGYDEAPDKTSEWALRREKAYFGLSPLRVEGRFFKIMATLPGITGHAPGDHHASQPTVRPGTVQAAPGSEERQSSASRTPPPSLRRASFSTGHKHAAASPRREAPPGSSSSVSLPEQPASSPGSRASGMSPSHPVPAPRRADGDVRIARILMFCHVPRNRAEIQKHVGMNNRDHFRKGVLNPIIAQGLLAPTRPDKPNSPQQRYVTVAGAMIDGD